MDLQIGTNSNLFTISYSAIIDPGMQIRVRILKKKLISQLNYMLWVLKRTVQLRRYLDDSKQMLKQMGMKMATILR